MIRSPQCHTEKSRGRKFDKTALLANEEGSVIVIALVMLMLLTMVGTSATNTATIELQVAGNERNYKQNFFKTEAAAMQGAQRVKDDAVTFQDTWITDRTLQYPNAIFDSAPTANLAANDTAPLWRDLGSNGSAFTNSYTMVVYAGVAPGGSRKETGSKNQLFSVYGQYYNTTKNEKMLIETAYSKRM